MSDKAFKGTIVNRALLSFHGSNLKLLLAVPLRSAQSSWVLDSYLEKIRWAPSICYSSLEGEGGSINLRFISVLANVSQGHLNQTIFIQTGVFISKQNCFTPPPHWHQLFFYKGNFFLDLFFNHNYLDIYILCSIVC